MLLAHVHPEDGQGDALLPSHHAVLPHLEGSGLPVKDGIHRRYLALALVLVH